MNQLTALTIATNADNTELIIIVPRDQETGMGVETFNVHFANAAEMQNALATMDIVLSTVPGGTPNASVNSTMIAEWDTRTALYAAGP